MAQDPYTLLGVSRQASADDIRSAFRKLAKQYHPDRNPGDSAAEERFKAISAAFEIIGDAEKKAKFDRGEIDAEGNERAPRGPFTTGAGGQRWQPRGGSAGPQSGFDDISDIFGDFFGGGKTTRRGPQPRKGADSRYRLTVDFFDAALGATKRVALGEGRGIDVTIPEGLRDGQTLRLKGQGAPGMAGGPNGDVFVEVTVNPHEFFRVEGDDLLVDVPITLKEAVLGGRIDIPTLQGSVMIKVPANTSSGVSFRLRGKGLKVPKTGAYGDLYAKTKIALPAQADPDLIHFIEGWAGGGGDPRKGLKP